MFQSFWNNIVNRGVTPDLEFNIRNKIRIFNSSIFIIGLIYLFYTAVGFIKGDILAGALTFLAYVLTASCLVMMTKKMYNLAYHTSAIVGIIFLVLFCLLYGESTQTHIFLLFIPIASIVLFDDMRICFVYAIITIASITLVKIYFIVHLPYYPDQPVNKYLGFFNIAMTCVLIYLAVRLFKMENLVYTKEINQQRDLIEEKNKDILSSIHYAKRIQKALLASETMLNENLPEHFVLYKPKDIVSGDFYWAEKLDSRFMIAVCDCTGHGVPGAFMSLLNISFMNEIVNERQIEKPDMVFNHLRDDIIKVLNPKGTLEEGKDGMDAVICSFDFKENKFDFACANNPIWLIRNKQMIEFKADKMPIGMYEGERRSFNLQSEQLQKGDLVYLFTDGYADQFGGAKGKKFKYKQMQDILLANAHLPMNDQKIFLDETIENWKSWPAPDGSSRNLEQVDDILVIGIRI